MIKFIILVFVLIFSSRTPSFACSESIGELAPDKQVASRICKLYKDINGILLISVQSSILYVYVSEDLYDAISRDQMTGKKLLRKWVQLMQQESGQPFVTVWVYVDKIKVIEAENKMSGEIAIKFY